MNCTVSQQPRSITRVQSLFVAALALACTFGTVSHAAAQVTAPSVPDKIAVPAGNHAYLVGHASGSQGYTCLPTSTGGTAWNPSARPEATLLTDFLGTKFQITHFQSLNENPKPGIVPTPSGNATWQASLDSSRVWMVRVNGIDPDPSVDSCRNVGSIQCLLLQSVGNQKGTTGGNLLTDTTFIQRLKTSGGAVPATACTVGQTQLVPYTADYFFFARTTKHPNPLRTTFRVVHAKLHPVGALHVCSGLSGYSVHGDVRSRRVSKQKKPESISSLRVSQEKR